MSYLVRITLATVLACLPACSVGSGVGAASGYLFELGCDKNGSYAHQGVEGFEGSEVWYDLHPTFFVGEPINDLRNYAKGTKDMTMSNRLTIRLQHSGKQIELNDVLTFDVGSSYEVARCVRGHVNDNGTNDWDETNCYRASPDGPGRLRVQYDSVVKASLTLHATCTANLVASAVSTFPILDSFPANAAGTSVPPLEWASWVEFEEFGHASQYEKRPEARDPITGHFKVDFGERIYATSFVLRLVDDSIVNAAIYDRPKTEPMIGGILGVNPTTGDPSKGDPTMGRFDFDLERGQSAQFFP